MSDHVNREQQSPLQTIEASESDIVEPYTVLNRNGTMWSFLLLPENLKGSETMHYGTFIFFSLNISSIERLLQSQIYWKIPVFKTLWSEEWSHLFCFNRTVHNGMVQLVSIPNLKA